MGYKPFAFRSVKHAQQVGYDVFCHDHEEHISALMGLRYKGDTLAEYLAYVDPVKNPLNRVAKAQSVLYIKPSRVYTMDQPECAQAIKDLAPGLYQALQAAQLMTYGLTDAFVMPRWTQDRFDFEVIAPHLVDVNVVQGALQALRMQRADKKYTIWTRYEWWVESGYRAEKWWVAPKRQETQKNPYNQIPVIWFRLHPYLGTWGIMRNKDLITGTLEINILEAFHNRVSYQRSFRQLTTSFDQVDTESVTARSLGEDVGPDTIVPYDLKSVELADPSDPFLKSIREQEIDLASSRGISSKSYFRDIMQGGEIEAVSEELKQRWAESQTLFSPPEKDLFRLLIKMSNNYTATSWDPDQPIMIEYVEPEIMTSKKAALETLEKAVGLGVDNVVDFIFRTNPEYRSKEQVEKKIEENLEYRLKYQVIPFRNTNSTTDPNALTTEPQENGSAGHPSENDAEQNGANGPKIAPNAINPKSIQHKPGTGQSAF